VTDEGRVEFANQAFCECFGLDDKPADLAGLCASDTIEKIRNSYRYPDEALARIQEVLDRVQPVMGEELAMQGGRTFLRDFIPLNIDGKSYGRLWLHTDITERDRAEEALRESESKAVFATLADFVPQMVWMCTPDGLNIYFNQRWAEYTGLTLEESYGRGWNTPFHPDDKLAAWDAWNHAVQTGEEYRVESRLRAADGRYRWFLMRGAPLRNAAQEIVRWFGTCTDIEDLKQAEQTQLVAQRRLTETVVRQLPCCVALVRGRDMTFQLVNPGYQALSPGQEMLGNSLQVFWPAIPGFEERCRQVLETGVSYEAVDEPAMISRSGGPPESAYFSWSMHRVNLPKEDGWGLLITAWETTGRKLAQEALLRSEKLASVGRMAATIAHEINNPLEAVMSLLFLAKGSKELPESTRQYLETADAEMNRIAHITRQSLGFYRESNAPALTSVNAVLESAVDLLKNKIKAKQAVIEKQWDGDVQVTAVAGELRQVFSNLLANSLDAIDAKGTIKLRVSTGAALKNGDRRVRITVADNGKGIDGSLRQQIFEPFFTTKGTVGTGLGLWVSKQIIDKHAGTIRVRSNRNGARRGTAFSIVLPMEPAAKALSQPAGA
jgi:PAS domain S-box-containing protein